MCGITGIYAFNMVGRVSMINIANATQALTSRGPDFQNMYNDQHVALGHRRLSIIDTSPSGHQPMWDSSGRYCIIFNGEIYNFQPLREQLKAAGIIFQSSSDTEVLLNLYIKEGKNCLERLNGFFAFAIYDNKEKSVFIARDRLGIKPLYYLHDDDRVLFASEMKSIIEYGIDKSIDFTALKTFLQLNYIPAPRTIFKHVKKLLPGEHLEISTQGVSKHKYYEVKAQPTNTDDYSAQKERLKILLEQSVSRRMVADVPLGSFLSGGIDSSVIATLASRYKPDLHTFSIGYQDEKYFDETAYAQLVANKIGTRHTVFSLTNKDLYKHLEGILDYIDEPFADSSAIAVYILSQETKKHATVALSGDGADELFAGYNKHAAFYRLLNGGGKVSIAKAFGPLWSILPKSRNSKITNLFRQLDRFSKGAKLSSKERYWRWAGFVDEQGADQLLSESSRQELLENEYQLFKNTLLAGIPAQEDINDLLLQDVKLVLPDDMLTKVDRMSMANGLEVRVPFLDHEVVEFAFSLPVDSKINSQIRKRILQDAYRDILPDKLYNRPKKGFEVPLLKWFRNEMKSLIVHDLLEENFIKEQGIFNPKTVKQLTHKLFSSNPGDVHARIWALIVFQWWWKKYVNN